MTLQTKSKIKETIDFTVGRLIGAEELPKLDDLLLSEILSFSVETPANSANGDFSCNVALISSKRLKMPPRKIAELIVEGIKTNPDSYSLSSTDVKKIEIAGPGFINFFMSDEWYAKAVSTVLKEADDYGKSDFGDGKRVLLEFVSANPTGPMHIGNARGGALGDCLASLLQFAGYNVEREFYVNDAGNQIEKFGLSLDIRYRQELGESAEMPEEAYKGEDIIAHAKNFIAIHGDKYLHTDETTRKEALVNYALPVNIQALKDDLAKYRIEYDNWFRESSLHENNAVGKIIEMLKEKGQTYEQDGAIWLKSTEYGDEKDRVLVRSNGVVTYIVPDIAYHYNKLVERGFDIAIDIFGADHHGYMPRMNAAMSALGIDTSRLKMIIMQMVRLVRAGEAVKLSKRSGKAITLTTLLDEVPVDAARFFFNLRDANTHLDFDLDLAIEETSKNPVYYVQYAHARIKSVMRQLEVDSGQLRVDSQTIYTEPAEFELIRKLSLFPEEITEAARNFDPSRLTRYTTETAQLFHKFYDCCRVKGEAAEVMQSRLALMEATGAVIRNALGIMKVNAPDKM
ncbi:MAG: arginine--tRNA ligase [Oscillospiraceae bacterium]|nr:arginine--tRNA ligase [Oscillospiraceae bacterium]